MAEPHELEERCAMAAVASLDDGPEWADVPPHEREGFYRVIRAVLALVRQEQENGQYSEKINEIWWNEGGPKPPLAEVIRAWWLSHTAKETSNG